MGGRAVAALNIAMFPNQPEFFPSLHSVMKGGNDKMAEAGVSVIGGHTIRDKEPKFGYTVMGLIHPGSILDNTRAKPGDAMILTKKIGTGIISTGVKAALCSEKVIEEFTLSMATLNKRAGEIMMEVGVSTATDVTGFGLIGHLHEVLSASRCMATVRTGDVPFFEEALRLVAMNKVPGGTMANFRSYSPHVIYHESVPDTEKILINDAQTSGGLLIFVPTDKKEALVSALQKDGILAAHVGDVTEGDAKSTARIIVER
jgi:selenide,water dikinase